jgi:hypothetical protein
MCFSQQAGQWIGLRGRRRRDWYLTSIYATVIMEEVFINAKLGAALLKRTSNLLQRNRLESTPVLNVKGSGKE